MNQNDSFLNLQTIIILNILSRLPPKTISQCRCVCKTFLSLISTPEFVNLNLSKSPETLLLHHLDSSDWEPKFTVLEFKKGPKKPHQIHSDPLIQFDLRKCIPEAAAGLTMVGSVNGLICLNEFENDRVYICNPTIREYITLPMAELGERVYPSLVAYGFGLGLPSAQYKVIRIFQEKKLPRTYRSEVQIYTIGSGAWRKVVNVPFQGSFRLHGVFLKGNLYWWIDDDGEEGCCSEFISCFDVEEEVFIPFPSPPELRKNDLGCVGVIGDRLCVCDNTSRFEIVVWVMNECGEERLWNKEMVIEKSPILPVGHFYEVVYALKVLDDGEILFAWQENSFFLYNPATKTVKIIDISEPNFEAKIYFPSFVSLQKCVTEEIKKFLS